MIEELIDPRFIIVADRGYYRITQSDNFKEDKQDFVIRMKNNVQIAHGRTLKKADSAGTYNYNSNFAHQ